MQLKKFKEFNCWESSKIDLAMEGSRGYKFSSIVHRNGHRYTVEQSQYIGSNSLYFRLTAPEDKDIPFEDIFLKGNGIRVGVNTPSSTTLLVQHKDIKAIEVVFEMSGPEVKLCSVDKNIPVI